MSSLLEVGQRVLDRQPECALKAAGPTSHLKPLERRPRLALDDRRRPNSTAGAVSGSQMAQDTPAGAQAQAVRQMKETKNKTVLAMRLEGNEGRSGLLQTIGNGSDSKIGPMRQLWYVYRSKPHA